MFMNDCVKEKRLHLLCVFSCLWSKNVLKFSLKKWVLKFFFVLLGLLPFGLDSLA